MKQLHERSAVPFSHRVIPLRGAGDEELKAFSKAGGLALSLEEMKAIQAYFESRARDPTDVELQSLGQAWSEHCCYKSSRFYLREAGVGFVKDDPWPTVGRILARGDAGVMEFDDSNAYALRIESHNHPSAVEPYGGAATGIGGILRDVLCMGAKPIALVDPLHFGPLDARFEDLPPGAKHPKYLLGGVVAGIRDYGNRVGVPTVAGCVIFDPGFLGNIIVNVGCVGIVPKAALVSNAVGAPGDVFLLCGGRTGRDGIHGVTYASLDLTEGMQEEWRAGAVQLGDPIMKEPLMHACLEASGRGLLSGMKDLGGGGLSCVVGEMAMASGFGAEVDLERVPLKEPGLVPWEIWVSESQERMMLAVHPSRLKDVLTIFQLYDVPATPIGTVVRDPVARVRHRGTLVLELDLEFLTKGPEYRRPYSPTPPSQGASPEVPPARDLQRILLDLLGSPNIASKEWVIRQYDHEVKASTVVKPLQGRLGRATHGDAAVVKPLFHSWRGLAITTASSPRLCALDPFRGGASVVDELCRNLAAVGARPDAMSDCLNFGNPEKADRMGAFREAVRGMAEVARAVGLAIPSGNVSFYNESIHGAVPPTPVALGVGIVEDIRRCVTVDLKAQGNILYLLGRTSAEMGGSEYYHLLGVDGGEGPPVDTVLLRDSLVQLRAAMAKGLVASCHDVSHGGLAVALVEMALGGGLGFEADLAPLGTLGSDVKLFSEANTSWVLEVPTPQVAELEQTFEGLPLTRLGVVGGGSAVLQDGGNRFEVALDRAWEAWSLGMTREVLG